MLGAQISEGRGKRTGRRVISTDPVKVEATAEEAAKFLGVEGTSIITYTSQIKPDGSLDGAGDGIFITLAGEVLTWKGIGVGRFGDDGSLHYCGSLSFTTTAQKLTKLNGVSGVFQWKLDPQGNTHSQIWEMAQTGVSQGATA